MTERCSELLPIGTLRSCPRPGSRGPSTKGRWKDIAHYHIAKNGGTTLRGILQGRYDGIELHGPQKRPYSAYFHSDEWKWRGKYFVVFVRKPAAKLLSQFYYARSELRGTFGRWHRCVDFLDYTHSRRARHNHQFAQLMTGQRGCGVDLPRPRHELGPIDLVKICPQGRQALEHRIAEVLTQPRIFVGVVEHFDTSLLALQRETGLPDVRYCSRRRHKNVLRVDDLPLNVVRDAQQRNLLDDILYNVSLQVFHAKACCYNISHADVLHFQHINSAFQQSRCPPDADAETDSEPNNTTRRRSGHTSRDRSLDKATLGNPMWRARGDDCDDIHRRRIGLTFIPPHESTTRH